MNMTGIVGMELTGDVAGMERPSDFSGVIGQDIVVEILRQRIRGARDLGRHLSFIGPAGSGKMTIARLYAQALVCEGPLEDGSPCRTCDECKAMLEGRSWAYVPIDAATNGDEEAIRTQIERDVGALNTAEMRIVVFENAERLVSAAADVALKTLERETNTIFIFLVNEDRYFSGALRSRCQVFRVRPVEQELLVGELAGFCRRRSIVHEVPALHVVARTSTGLYGIAMKLLARVSGQGEVTLPRTLDELGLSWGAAMLRCWGAIFARKFDEALVAFESVGPDGASRIEAMQAFLLEFELRNAMGDETVSVSPALVAVSNENWVRVTARWDRANGSGWARGMLHEALGIWREIRLDTPWEVAFRGTYEEVVQLMRSQSSRAALS